MPLVRSVVKEISHMHQKTTMVFYINPCQRFSGFDEDFHFERGANMMTNLVRYCGFKTLHQDCWLWKYLQGRIRYFKFSGEEEFRKWCTYPKYCDNFKKLPHERMKVTWPQMNKWRHYLKSKEDEINSHCYGQAWSKYYKPDRSD